MIQKLYNQVIRKLQWLGHVACMPDCYPQKDSSWVAVKTRPAGEPCIRWQNHIRKDLKQFNELQTDWCHKATTSRKVWHLVYHVGLDDVLEQGQQQQESRSQLDTRVLC